MRQLLLLLSLPIILILISGNQSASVAQKPSSNVPDESKEWNNGLPLVEKHSRHKRGFMAGVSLFSNALGMVSFIYGLVSGIQTSKQLDEIQLTLKEMDHKIDIISRDIEKLHATALYGQHVSRVRFFLSQLTNFLTVQNGALVPADFAQTWADSVLDLGRDGIKQILHDFHDMVIGNSHLFASKPIFTVFEKALDRSSSSYPGQVQEIVDWIYSIQTSGYAVWITALTIKGKSSTIASVQHVARERFTNQMKLMYRLTTAWPAGSYGLPMTDTGCPNETETGVEWKTGYRYHDTVIDNEWSRNLRFPAGSWGKDFVYQHFCMMNNTAGLRSWPNGEYCIFRKGDCPQGFSTGFIEWDDDDNHNANRMNGSLPDGKYLPGDERKYIGRSHLPCEKKYHLGNRGTSIQYCCRSDASPSIPIDLPTDKPFYFLRYKSTCQQVRNMRLSNQFFWWDDQNYDNRNCAGGSHPNTGSDPANHKIHYCYYF